MAKLTLQEKALAVIEVLVSDDLTQDLEFNCLMHPDRTPILKDDDAKIINKKLTAIYCAAHSVNPHGCYNVHDGWRKEVEKRYRQFVKAGEIPTRKEASK